MSFTQYALVSLNNKTAWDPRQSIENLIKKAFFDQLEIAASTLVMHHNQHDSPYTSYYKISKIIFSEECSLRGSVPLRREDDIPHNLLIFNQHEDLKGGKEGKRGVCRKCFHCYFLRKVSTYLFSLTKTADGSFGLGIVEVKCVIIVEITLENKPHRQNPNK